MAGSEAVALMIIVVIAYYIVSYWRKLMFLLAVVTLSIFGFGTLTIIGLLHSGQLTVGG